MFNPKKNKENNNDFYEKAMEEIKSDLIWEKAEKHLREVQEIKEENSSNKKKSMPLY